MDERINTKKIMVLCFIVSFLGLAVCTKSSFLYPLNDWCDSNIYLTVGRGIEKGLIPYRDLLDHKGPVLYFLHFLAIKISNTSFLGVFIFQVIAASAFLYACYKILRLYTNKFALYVLPIIMLTVYTSSAYCAGDSAEEFCLPLLTWSMYFVLDALENGQSIPAKRLILIGIFSGCVLMIKYTMLGFYIGWFMAQLIMSLIKHDMYRLPRIIGWIAVGVGIVAIPCIVYFIVNGALLDFLVVYFWNNMTAYTADLSRSERVYHLCSATVKSLWHNVFFSIPCLVGFVWMILNKKWELSCNVIPAFVGTFIFVFIGGQEFVYYGLIMATFTCFGWIPICNTLRRVTFRRRTLLLLVECITTVVFSVIMSENTYLLRYKKEDLPQYKFAEIMRSESAENEIPTLLNYGFLDGGFYLASNTIPTIKVFCHINMPLDEVSALPENAIKNGSIKYIVTRGELPDTLASQYRCIASEDLPYVDGGFLYSKKRNFTYYLYRLA